MTNHNEQIAYPRVDLLIAGQWRQASDGASAPVINPATEEEIGRVPIATLSDLEQAVLSTEKAFQVWRQTAPHERYQIMKGAARLLAARAREIGLIMTLEQGKPVAQAQAEVANGADLIEWFAEEGRRISNRLIPARIANVEQRVIRDPIGPVAAFTPWNFPVNQAVRKISAAVAAGCTIILKGPEDTPASCAALVAAFTDAGLPEGVINLVYGNPSQISDYLIKHPVVRKVSFTGSTAVGKQLASLAGSQMKPVTMELGGHGPVLILSDADVERAATILCGAKYRNAGQICTAPTRFIVHDKIRAPFLEAFVEGAKAIRVGNGLDPETQMGPVAHERRLAAMEMLVADAVAQGAKVAAGGKRIGNRGFFFEPTVLTDVPLGARAMNEEPFGPVALINSCDDEDAMVAEANRLPYGLASYVYTRSPRKAADLGRRLEAGMISINHHGLGLPEVPFGGIRDSGHGNEGGAEALDAYLVSKYITHYDTH
ncbi:NAD-dependent succinate-semialdehyde dehydrogenase [Rhodoligotrophos ferricapiens]|uniref:NAD-dependent succinate-semialdehyde dehydrogenase n=1 Tax=Rhodoligotrophos ferricapiens TaxID=3069264 RepID=UPI00315C5A67